MDSSSRDKMEPSSHSRLSVSKMVLFPEVADAFMNVFFFIRRNFINNFKVSLEAEKLPFVLKRNTLQVFNVANSKSRNI